MQNFDLIIIEQAPIGLACGVEAKSRIELCHFGKKNTDQIRSFNYPVTYDFFLHSDRLEDGHIPFYVSGEINLLELRLWILPEGFFPTVWPKCKASTKGSPKTPFKKQRDLFQNQNLQIKFNQTKENVFGPGFYDLPKSNEMFPRRRLGE